MKRTLPLGENSRLLAGTGSHRLAARRSSRWLLAAALSLLGLGTAQAQLSVPFGNPITATGPASVNLPLNAATPFVRQAAIYAASEINAPAGTITRLSYFVQSATTPGANPTKVYMKHVTNTAFTAPTTVAAEETGATLVYDSTIPAANFVAGGYVPIILGTGAGTSTFAYDGTSNLEIIVESNAGVGTTTEASSAKAFRTFPTAGNSAQHWTSATAPPTGNGTLSATFRPNVLLGGLGYSTDAGVQTIYPLNRLAIAGVSPHAVQAAVRNNSFTAQTNVPVTLTVTGPGGFTFTNTQTIASLPVGSTPTMVTFAGYTPTTAGAYTVTVSTADAGNTTNNSQTLSQTVTDAPGFSSYINGNPATARGFAAAGSGNGFAVKIPTGGAVTVTAMRAKLGVTGASAAGKTVYGVVLNPATGAILARSNDYVITAADEATAGAPVTLTMQTPVIVGAGNLMVGVVQTYQTGQTAQYFPFAAGFEYPLRTGVYYSFSTTAPAAPTDLASTTAAQLSPSYRLLMEAVTTAAPACVPPTNLAAGSVTTTAASLTFTGDAGTTNYTVSYVPTAGGTATTVSPAPTGSPVALSGLQPGTEYTATVTSNCSGGTTSTSATTTFTTLPTVDASTAVVYSLYKLPIPFGGPHAVQAVVTNNGTSTLTNLPVNLSVTGVGGFTFTNTQTVPSLAAGASATVTFAGYTPSTAGPGTVTVTTNLSGDQISGNNAKTQAQVATTTDFSYTDATAPGSARGFGVSTNVSAFAAKFTLTAPRNVTGVRAYLVDFVSGAGSTVGKTVYGVLLNATTGVVLATSAPLVVTAANINTYTAFTFTTPVTLASGDFLVGLAQTYQTGQTTQYFPIGTQPEVPGRSGTFFTASITSPAAPAESGAANNIKFMLEAVTDVPPACVAPSNLTFSNATPTSVTVNFTAPFVVPSAGYIVTYTPTGSGAQPVTTTTTSANITGLTAGTTYTFSVRSDCGGSTSTAATGTFTAVPANDQCSGAVALTCGGSVTGTTRGSTSTGDPSGSHAGGTIFPAAGGVWYSFAGTGDRVTASLCTGTSSSFDSQLFVFSGSCGSLTDVAADDDGCGVGGLSTVTFFTTAGTTYYVYVTGFVNSGVPSFSDFTLTTTCVSPDLTVSTAQAISGIYRNVTVTGPNGVATLSNDLTVTGTLTVQNGGTISGSTAFYVQGPGNFVLQAGGTFIEPNSVGITNDTNGSFDLGGTVTLSPDANYVFNAAVAQSTGALMPARARNLTVNNSAVVLNRRLTLTNSLQVAQRVRLQSGNLVLNGKSLVLLSDASGTALIDNTGGVVTGATGQMQRAITSSFTSVGYRHFSSPVSGSRIDTLSTGGSLPVVNAAYNSSATPGFVTPFPTVYGYDETRIGTATNNFTDFNKGWFSPASGSDAMVVGKGYTVQAAATATPVHFSGTFNTGAQNSGALSRGTSADAGWHLLGNPYPSPLDWSTVTAGQRPGMDAAMYVYQANSQYNGSYRSYVNGVGASPLIDAGSGYFVRVLTAGTPGAVNLTDANRVTTFGPQPAFGRGMVDSRPQLQLQVAGAGLTDLTHLYVQAGATAALDAEYDATKLANPHGLNLASLAGQQAVAINGLPTLAGTRETVIPLTLAAPAAGSFTFSVPLLNNFGSTTVWLRDALTGTQQQLVAGGSYQFTLATALSGTGRFALAFRPTGALAAATALDAASVRVFPNPAHGRFTVLLPPVADQRAVQAELLNVLGQVVTTRTIGLTAAGASAEFETAALAKGVYLLRLTAGSRTITQRVVVE